jgi:hypothetical protein
MSALSEKHRFCGPKGGKCRWEMDLLSLWAVRFGVDRGIFLRTQLGQFPFTGTVEPQNFVS